MNGMSQELRQLPPIDLNAPHPRTSNRTTPSQKRHINSLPPELLFTIFWNYCSFTRGPDPLISVCRSWHTIVSAFPALWTCITFERHERPYYLYGINDRPILCGTWSDLERTLPRAGAATLSLSFELSFELYLHDEEEHVPPLFRRCRNLCIALWNVKQYTFTQRITMPHLESLRLNIDATARIEPLIDSIERSSPLLRSLCISSFFPANLAQHEPLLRRIVHLELHSPPDDNTSFFRGLQNLEELVINQGFGKAIEISPSTLPKLVSLQIRHNPLSKDQSVTFPALETLTLCGEWSNLLFIAAPNLRNLVLIARNERESEEQTMSTLRQATVLPTSFSTEFISDIYLPELLEMWSTLSELHLRGRDGACIPGPIATAVLAGSDVAAPLCSSLRYLTVHMEHEQKDLQLANQSIQRLQTIVEERKSHGLTGLQRVMCVWEYLDETNSIYYPNRKEVEWVDVL